jgi:hypothetical protein
METQGIKLAAHGVPPQKKADSTPVVVLPQQSPGPIEKNLLQAQAAVQIGCAAGVNESNKAETSTATQDLRCHSPGIPPPPRIAEQVYRPLRLKAENLARIMAGHLLHGSMASLAAINADSLQAKDRPPGGQATCQLKMDEHISAATMNDVQG